MTGIIRTWRCLNARCTRSFDAWEPNPTCPSCQGVRVEWQPAGGHIGGYSKNADVELRALADMFKLGAKKVALPPATAPNGGNVHTFAGGFSAAVNPSVGAQCVPTANKIDYKVKATPGNQLMPNGSFPSVRSNTAVEAAYKG